jgi:hypothetical protein
MDVEARGAGVTPDEHFVHLAEFIRGVELAGGTTPHVSMTVGSMSRIEDPLEKLWFAGCYALTYNWPAAERLFLELRPGEMTLPWLDEHWDGIPLRKERKSVYRKWAFLESATAYAAFARELMNASRWTETYEDAFGLFNDHTRFMGRYIAIRWLEVMRRAFPDQCAGWTMPSILSDGGQHPRKTLALVYPQYSQWLLGGNTAGELKIADAAADQCLLDLRLEYGLETNYYELQSLLCEYKQSALGRKQYPGKSIDTEMDYFTLVRKHWGNRSDSSFWDVRRVCFPDWSRGEFQDRWYGVRPELGAVLADYGYVWSDVIYAYNATKAHSTFAEPVRKHGSELLLP